MYIYAKNSLWKHMDFFLLDIIVMVTSYAGAFFVRHKSFDTFSELYYQIGFSLFLTYVCWVILAAPHRGILRRRRWKELQSVLLMNVAFLAVVTGYLFFAKHIEDYSRVTLFLFLMMDVLLTWASRTLLKVYLTIRYRTDKGRKWLVLASKEEAESVLKQYYYKQQGDIEIVGLAILNQSVSDVSQYPVPVVTTEEQMWEYLRISTVDEVLVGSFTSSEGNMRDILLMLVETGLTVHLDVGDLPLYLPNQTVHHIGEMTVITGAMKVIDPLQSFLKRALDIVGALVGLLITALVGIIVIPAIKLDSPGPAFFGQERVGKNGRKFKMYKFRSMYIDAEERKKELMAENKMDGLMFKMDDDPRITKVGAFIRKTSIDELPQFFNVLMGDMSIVGTRPPTVDEYEQYELLHKRRLSIKPGITGLWQVSGRSAITDFEEVVALDTKYIMDWNIMTDVRILLKTVEVVLKRKGAI